MQAENLWLVENDPLKIVVLCNNSVVFSLFFMPFP